MTETSVRSVIAVAALAVGFLGGWLVTRATPLANPPSPKFVFVDQDAKKVTPWEIHVSKSTQETIVWGSNRPGHDLVIETEQPIFVTRRPQHGRFATDCRGASCYSAQIDPSTKPGKYKYWQLYLKNGGIAQQEDAWIIIEK